MEPSPEVRTTSSMYNNDSDTEDCVGISRDSGHGSYSTLRTQTPDRNTLFSFDTAVGLNVSMNGDMSETSDGEDSPCDKPSGIKKFNSRFVTILSFVIFEIFIKIKNQYAFFLLESPFKPKTYSIIL